MKVCIRLVHKGCKAALFPEILRKIKPNIRIKVSVRLLMKTFILAFGSVILKIYGWAAALQPSQMSCPWYMV
jgi:hypothetical protein